MRAPTLVLILLASFFTLGIHTLFAQIGIYGPVSTHIKAGDPAPDLSYAKILSASGGVTTWNSVDFTGKFTVLAFFPDTSHNIHAVSLWNAIVDLLIQKPVMFACFTGDM